MQTTWTDYMKMFLSTVIGIVLTALGGYDAILRLLIILIALDMVTGAMQAIKMSKFRLKISIWGVSVKICEIATIAVCNALDVALGTEPWLRNIAIIWYIICEAASVLEHMARLGVPMPEGLINVLAQAKQGFGISITKIAKKILQEYAKKVISTASKEKNKELEEKK